jgi:IrrE N-terminal-like domain
MPIDPFLRRQIIATAEAALQAADVVGVLPTPLEHVGEVVGVGETIDIGDLPDDLTIAKPRSLRRILGAYAYRTNTAFVDLSQPLGRRRFIQAHETGHKLIPWHEASYHLDDEARLFRDTEEELEDEANLAGTLLVFQGGRFHARALDYENSIRTPILLAEEFGASYHTSIRYYVEHHPEPIAVVIAGRYPRADGTVPIFTSVESKSFRERFGSFSSFFGPRGVSLVEADHPFAPLARSAYGAVNPLSDITHLRDRAGRPVRCTIDTFYNQRCLFILVATRGILRRGRRVAIEAG